MNSLFTLVLNGSPSASGHGMTLADVVLRTIGGTYRVVGLYDLVVAPCRDCRLCTTRNGCRFQDDMPRIFGGLAEADLVLVVSPLHFVSLTAPVVALYSRLQPLWQARRRGEQALPPRRRAGGLVLTGGSAYRNMFEPARAVTAAMFNSIAVPFVGMTTASETDTMPVEANGEALLSARTLGRDMAAAVVREEKIPFI